MLEGGIIGEIGTEAVAKDDAPDTIVAGLGGGDRGEVVGGVGGIKAAAAHFVGVDRCASSVTVEMLVVVVIEYCRVSVCVRFLRGRRGLYSPSFPSLPFPAVSPSVSVFSQFSALVFVDSFCAR